MQRDPELLEAFVAEAGELLEQLEADLVTLERTPDDAALINTVFRALHTIKGGGSFLDARPLVQIAHAAETALNAVRGGDARVDQGMMNNLLAAVDTLGTQLSQLREGIPLTEPLAELVGSLNRIGSVKDAPAVQASAPPPAAASPGRPLILSPEKQTLVEFLIADLNETIGRARTLIGTLQIETARSEASVQLADTAEMLLRALEFFGLDEHLNLATGIGAAAEQVQDADATAVAEVIQSLTAAVDFLDGLALGLAKGHIVPAMHTDCTAAILCPRQTNVDQAHQPNAVAAHTAVQGQLALDASPRQSIKPIEDKGPPRSVATPRTEPTIRVEVSRLEVLMNLVGELVLQKNRVAALARRCGATHDGGLEFAESLLLTSNTLDRVSNDIQSAVMRTRLQPLDRLFGKYPRLIRDLAMRTGKCIELLIEGEHTEVDKSVLDTLGDPLVHLLRNCADHGIEQPEQRRAAGKPETGIIRLSASHEGSYVRIVIADDGRGLNREKIGAKAVEKGLLTKETLAQMSDDEVHRLIFKPGFSTADAVSDLSGRGVGMDVALTSIERLGGAIDLESAPGRGAKVCISIPLTVAILQAMMVQIGEEVYALPLTNVREILKPEAEQIRTIRSRPVLRLRESVLPLLRGPDVFGMPAPSDVSAPFAIVVTAQQKEVALMVTRLVGQQEIVVKALDVPGDHGGPVSGATVRDDGGISLIVDVGRLLRSADGVQPCRPRPQTAELEKDKTA